MTLFCADVAARAKHELSRWKGGTGKETDDPFAAFVGEYWSVGLKNAHINGRTTFQDAAGKKFRPAWSSAFISFIYRTAGAGAEFFYHEGHIHYVVKAIRDAAPPTPTAKFLGRDPTKYKPKVGDIINAGRGVAKGVTFKTVLAKYGPKVVPKGGFMPSHSDIVVAVDAAKHELTTIGGNVSVDTVGAKTLRLNPDGTLIDGKSMICVIECLL